MVGIQFILDLGVVALIAGVAGLLARAAKLSAIVGYLVAGILMGPSIAVLELVQSPERVQMLADLGLIFLIFGIGLGFSLRRMRRLGTSLLLTTGLGALLVLLASRTISSLVGLTDQQGLFVAGALMVSSSAIIAKVLEESKANHTRWGQLALGVTLLEDIVAITMLTLLSSMVTIGTRNEESIWYVISSFTGFVILLTVLILLLVPALLRWLDRHTGSELRILIVAGMLLLLGWGAQRMGYSMALSAFLLGAVIGSTPQRSEVERLFEGMRHLFGAVFFVAMGMMFDARSIGDFWPGLLALTAAALLLRGPALGMGLLLTGSPTRDAFKAALALTPLGEFSFVIAFLGVRSGIMPDSFYPAAVGASLLTCLIFPGVVRHAEPLATGFERRLPAPVERSLAAWHAWLERLQNARARSFAWKLIAPRIRQTLLQLLTIGGGIAVLAPASQWLERQIGPNLLFPNGTTLLLLLAGGILLLPPLVAVWRNIGALSMIVAEATTQGKRSAMGARPLIRRLFTLGALGFIILWLSVLLPTDVVPLSVLVVILAILVLVTILLWKNLIFWQSRIENILHDELKGVSTDAIAKRSWMLEDFTKGDAWQLSLEEFVLPLDSLHAGRRILDLALRTRFSCSIVGIDRQGFAINSPAPADRLYPGDTVLLLGTRDALKQATTFLAQRSSAPEWLDLFDELATESIVVPDACPCVDRPLSELNLVTRFGVMIAGIRREGAEIPTPGAKDVLREGDRLLVVGTHKAIRTFAESLAPSTPPETERIEPVA
jgi:CPA2 family monovalent cation:H+ antiporter-2